MNRPQPLLERHLLTRSDLASMQVPAIDVFRWLTEGCLEQVGELPAESGRGEPVFTVLPDELRRELSEKLAAIGKSTVVLTPLGVRSFLLRAILTERGLAVPAAVVDGVADGASADATLPEELMMSDLAEVLHNAALEVVDDVQAVLELAAEVAASESAARAQQRPAADDDEQTTPLAGGDEIASESPPQPVGADEEQGQEQYHGLEYDDLAEADALAADVSQFDHGDADACFDFDDLTEELGGLDFDDNAFAAHDSDGEPDFTAPTIGATAFDEPEPDQPEPDQPDPDQPERQLPEPEPPATELRLDEDEHQQIDGDARGQEPGPAAERRAANEAAAEAADTTEPHDPVDAFEPATEAPAAAIVPEPGDDNDGVGEAGQDPAPAARRDGSIAPDHDDDEMLAAVTADEPAEATAADDPAPAAVPAPDAADAAAAAAARDEQVGAATEQQPQPEPTADDRAPAAESPAEAADAAHEQVGAATEQQPRPEPVADDAPTATPPVTDHVAAEVAPVVASERAETTSADAMARVESFLGELKGTLVELAQRPQPSPVDVDPLVQAVQTGFERSAEQASQTASALTALSGSIGKLGDQVEQGMQRSVQALAQRAPAAPVAAPAPAFVAVRPDRQTLVLGAVAVLVVCWSILFWVKTGSPRLALGTLVGANLIGCCLLLARRDRG